MGKQLVAVMGALLGIGLLIVSVLLWSISNDLPESETQMKFLSAGGLLLAIPLIALGYMAIRPPRDNDEKRR